MKRSGLAFLLLAFCTRAGAQFDPTAVPPGSRADPVTFRVIDFPCDLSIFGKLIGPIELNQPKVVRLPRGKEYLVECSSFRIPVKLYARRYLFAAGDFQTGALPNEVVLQPVAVLPNVVKAVATGGLVATTVRDAIPYQCKRPPKAASASDWSRERGEIIIAKDRPIIPKNTKVLLSPSRPEFCFDTNLVGVQSPSGATWYRNEDFVFSHEGKAINLYPPSQHAECCWIE